MIDNPLDSRISITRRLNAWTVAKENPIPRDRNINGLYDTVCNKAWKIFFFDCFGDDSDTAAEESGVASEEDWEIVSEESEGVVEQ